MNRMNFELPTIKITNFYEYAHVCYVHLYIRGSWVAKLVLIPMLNIWVWFYLIAMGSHIRRVCSRWLFGWYHPSQFSRPHRVRSSLVILRKSPALEVIKPISIIILGGELGGTWTSLSHHLNIRTPETFL